MFEKNAEKWVSNHFKLYLREPSVVVAKHAYKDGAEFIYNKAKELLNEFMRISKASDEDFEHDYSELIRETEQFLNGKVVK